MSRDICIDRLKYRAQAHASELSYFFKDNNQWQGVSWQRYHNKVRDFAKALMSMGIAPEDKIAILSFSRLEWVCAAMGAQYMGGVFVGIYTTSAALEVEYIIKHSEAKVLLVENADKFEKQVKPILSALDGVQKIVIMNDEKIDSEKVIGFSEFLACGQEADDSELDRLFERVEPESLATMIYTSGTTGNPKAVMLSHASVAWTVRAATKLIKCGSYDTNISYLPLAHIAEQMFTLYAPVDCGMKTYFSTSFEALKEELLEVEPTIFFGVPRVYEKMYDAIKFNIDNKGKVFRTGVSLLNKLVQRYYCYKNADIKPDWLTRGLYSFAKHLVFGKIRKKLGLARARGCFCGAAPISKEILSFFFGIDIPIYELYGLSETTGPASVNMPRKTKVGSVGHALPGAKIKIADDGEILISGPHVCMGYYKDEGATREAIKNGWLYTGDVGELDHDGYLNITDRKKDILITAGGKNISPQNLENRLKTIPYIESAVVVGDGRKYLCALFTANKEFIKSNPQKIEDTNSLIHDGIRQELAKINQNLAPVEQIKNYSLLKNEFSVDTGEFTPTLKIKRKFINEKYKAEIDKLYQ